MATAEIELTNLKLAAAKKRGDEKISIVNHDVQPPGLQSCTLKEGIAILADMASHGRSQAIVHIVYVDQDRRRKRLNEPREGRKPQVRFMVDCGTPEIFKDLYCEWDRILTQVGNKTVALSILIDWLRALTEKRIAKKLEEGTGTPIAKNPSAPGPPPAQLPKWMQP
jgi:hypothetical protein